MKIPDLERLSGSQLAAIFQVHKSQPSCWVRKGCPRHKDGSFDLKAALAWRMDQLTKSHQSKREEPHALDRKRLLESEKLQEQLKVMRGMETLPRKIAFRLASMTDIYEIEKLLSDSMDELCETFARE